MQTTKKKADRARHSLTLEMVKAQLDSEDAVEMEKKREEARQLESCRKAFEPIRAMWLEVKDGPSPKINEALTASVVTDTDAVLKFRGTAGCSAFRMLAYCPGGREAELYFAYNEDGMGHPRSLEEVQAEFVKYLARRLRPSRSALNI